MQFIQSSTLSDKLSASYSPATKQEDAVFATPCSLLYKEWYFKRQNWEAHVAGQEDYGWHPHAPSMKSSKG